ncbi:HEAT repeat domain-containing protein [Paraliobacillus sp. JSM ZJ581]|uniref:HEAT repeat domain-containing protein n=1 Tax=Paraliobacillus sp. JSM ZJ581 TaxID=3342118 RepID=UPI0035A8CF8F
MFVLVTYVYFIICLLILFYTISYIFYQWYDNQRQVKNTEKYVIFISEHQQFLIEEEYKEPNHLKQLSKLLKNTKQLIAFEQALDQLKKNQILSSDYLKQIEPVIVRLIANFQQKDQMKQAYLARFIATYAKDNWHDPLMYKTLISYLDNATIFLRENVLAATYQQADPKWIINVYHYLTDNNLFHHPKLIQDGLLDYPYNHELLIDTLWKHRHSFNQSILLGIIGFITFTSDRYKKIFYNMLKTESLDLEVKTRLIRYFKKHHEPKATNLLISLASDRQDPIRIVTVFVLREYPSKNVIETLKKALTDANWHVRRNASQSLLAMNVPKEDLLDVLHGHDRYAKEMLQYHLHMEGAINE